MTEQIPVDVAIVGGGQAGLATAFYLRRAGLAPGRDFVVLDAGTTPGGAWCHMWDGLRLFSPAAYSSLPGWMMPAVPGDETGPDGTGHPPREHVVDYLTRYEDRYDLQVRRPHRVDAVRRADSDSYDGRRLLLEGSGSTYAARAVVSATGTWGRPFWPAYPGMRDFAGRQLHAAQYHRPEEFAGQRVVVVGGGNSAAQVLAEVSRTADTTWVTSRPPRFLPDDVDGRDLFAAATRRVQALRRGEAAGLTSGPTSGQGSGVAGLGDIVMVPSVREARDRGVLQAHPMFTGLTRTGVVWADGTTSDVDVVIWCTGFRPDLRHLAPLGLRTHHARIRTVGAAGTRAADEPGLFLVGYGDWTGPASATLIGVGRSARDTAAEIAERIAGHRPRVPTQ